jgi:hypothetical protein
MPIPKKYVARKAAIINSIVSGLGVDVRSIEVTAAKNTTDRMRNTDGS